MKMRDYQNLTYSLTYSPTESTLLTCYLLLTITLGTLTNMFVVYTGIRYPIQRLDRISPLIISQISLTCGLKIVVINTVMLIILTFCRIILTFCRIILTFCRIILTFCH